MEPSLTALSAAFEKFPDIYRNIESLIVLRAQYAPFIGELLSKAKKSLCVQQYKPIHDQLVAKGFNVSHEYPSAAQYDLVILLLTQQRDENLFLIAKASSLLKEGGLLISTAQNNLGAERFERHQRELFGVIESYSKHKCRVFWSRKQTVERDLLGEWLELGKARQVAGGALVSYSGLYGFEKIDKGSELLIGAINQPIHGRVGDLGCGYGYLSYALLSNQHDISEISLYDTEALALQAAKINLSKFNESVKLSFNWCDCTKEPFNDKFDFIIMNPPFHFGKITDPQIGARFIEGAWRALKEGGKLFMVANVKLPYEEVLKKNFSNFEKILESGGYKILMATK